MIDARARRRTSLWAVVLAGGEGARLGQTLDRVGLLVPPERTVVVTLHAHARYVERELGATRHPHVLSQPESRGTAAGILLAAQWIAARDLGATLVCVPSDHLVVEGAAFMEHLADLAAFAEREPRRIVLLGAPPTHPETEYGWIEPGDPVGQTAGGPVRAIRRFHEKPARELASALVRRGALWNTFVFAARVPVLLSAGRECAPALYDRLAALRAFAGGEHEPWARRQAYALAPTVDFSRAVLEACPQMLAVSELPGLTWCDLGSPERVVTTLTRLGISAPWLATYAA
jgi:mannose-1-phosphate guanylyltransferase